MSLAQLFYWKQAVKQRNQETRNRKQREREAKRHRNQYVMESLEHRILLSGDPLEMPTLELDVQIDPNETAIVAEQSLGEASGQALAPPTGPAQVVYSSNQAVTQGGVVSLDVEYSTINPDNEQLAGVGLRLHYDSSLLTPLAGVDNFVTDIFQDELQIEVKLPQNDQFINPDGSTNLDGFDGDPNTDKYIAFLWADNTGPDFSQWPDLFTNNEQLLFTANFVSNIGSGQFTEVKFSGSPAVGHEFVSGVVQRDGGGNIIDIIPEVTIFDANALLTMSVVDTADDNLTAPPITDEFIHEWEPFFVEIWAQSPTNGSGFTAWEATLNYNSAITTATNVVYGPGFTQNSPDAINDGMGIVPLKATGNGVIGDGGLVRVARVQFEPLGADQANVNVPGQFIGPYNLGLTISQGAIDLANAPAIELQNIDVAPPTDLWAVVYDFNDDNQLTLGGDLAPFSTAFNGDANDPLAWWADFTKTNGVTLADLGVFASNFAKNPRPEPDISFPDNFPEAWGSSPLQSSSLMNSEENSESPENGNEVLLASSSLVQSLTEEGSALHEPPFQGAEVDVELVAIPLADIIPFPQPGAVTSLPEDLLNVSTGDLYVVEVWVQDLDPNSGGLVGGFINLGYDPAQAVALQANFTGVVVVGPPLVSGDIPDNNHGFFGGGAFTSVIDGTINPSSGQIENFGGGTLTTGLALEPDWERLGFMIFEALGEGPITFTADAATSEQRLFARFEGEAGVDLPSSVIDFDVLTINAVTNRPPVITSDGGGATANVMVAENTTMVTRVEATDLDGDTPTFDKGPGGADNSFFNIDSNTGELSFINAPDFENPSSADGDNIYEVIVRANDGNSVNGTTTQTINVEVTNAVVPTISIGDVSQAEGDGGTTVFLFDVTLSEATTETVTVDYATADQTAAAGSDYVAATGTVTFNPGETAQQVMVTVNGDTTVELDETFVVNLSNAVNGVIAVSPGTGTIENDDSATVAINDVSLNEGDGPGTTAFVFDVTLTGGPVDTDVTVAYTTADDSATAGSDYTATSGTATITAGTTDTTITVDVTGDTDFEPNETFFVDLSNLLAGGRAVTLVGAQGLGTIVNDDGEPTAAIGDRVWLDTNGDGVQNAGEPGVQGVTVSLKDGTGAIQGTTVTDANGNYLFDNLTPGDYSIGILVPDGFELTTQDAGGDDAVDSDADPTTGMTGVLTLASGETNLTVDLGLVAIPNNAPVITSNGGGDIAQPDPILVEENSTFVTDVNADDDGPQDALQYRVSGGADETLFAVNPNTGVLSFITPPDFENPQGAGDNTYTVEVEVSDGEKVDTQLINVQVTNFNADHAPGDANGDGVVDEKDVAAAFQFLRDPVNDENEFLDLNGNGRIDIADFRAWLRTEWLVNRPVV